MGIIDDGYYFLYDLICSHLKPKGKKLGMSDTKKENDGYYHQPSPIDGLSIQGLSAISISLVMLLLTIVFRNICYSSLNRVLDFNASYFFISLIVGALVLDFIMKMFYRKIGVWLGLCFLFLFGYSLYLLLFFLIWNLIF